MGTGSLTISLLLLLGCTAIKGELSLSPRVTEVKGDGVTFHHLVFSDGSTEITYQCPPGWDYTGSSTRLTLHPRSNPLAEASVARVPLDSPRTFDAKHFKDFVTEAVSTVPAGSTEIQILTQEASPVKIGLKDTFLVTISYVLNGQRFGRSLMFMNRYPDQLRFQLTSRLEDFPELQTAFFRSAFTWSNL